jgi:hypothetical protein
VFAQWLLNRANDLTRLCVGDVFRVPVGVAVNPSEQSMPTLGQTEELVTDLNLREPAPSCVARGKRDLGVSGNRVGELDMPSWLPQLGHGPPLANSCGSFVNSRPQSRQLIRAWLIQPIVRRV